MAVSVCVGVVVVVVVGAGNGVLEGWGGYTGASLFTIIKIHTNYFILGLPRPMPVGVRHKTQVRQMHPWQQQQPQRKQQQWQRM